MTDFAIGCNRCGKSSCPSVGGRYGVCPREELDELKNEWLDLLTEADTGRLADALAELSFNVKALRAKP